MMRLSLAIHLLPPLLSLLLLLLSSCSKRFVTGKRLLDPSLCSDLHTLRRLFADLLLVLLLLLLLFCMHF
jgi:hypothetical protein